MTSPTYTQAPTHKPQNPKGTYLKQDGFVSPVGVDTGLGSRTLPLRRAGWEEEMSATKSARKGKGSHSRQFRADISRDDVHVDSTVYCDEAITCNVGKGSIKWLETRKNHKYANMTSEE